MVKVGRAGFIYLFPGPNIVPKLTQLNESGNTLKKMN